MDIRSITLFCEPDFAPTRAKRFFDDTHDAFPYPVQTRRLALPPFPEWWDVDRPAGAQAEEVARRWQSAGADYISVGPVQLQHDLQWLNRLPNIIGTSDTIFAAAEVTDTNGTIHTGRCAAVARIIQQVSRLRPDGFGNLYFAALANCPPGSPFFPAAYHRGGPPCFALAVESADLALHALQSAATLAEARANLVAAIEEAATTLQQAAGPLAQAHDLIFGGIDFSLAPFPTHDKSLAGTLESLGLPWLGSAGSLFAATFVAEAIDRARFPRCGFSGLMLPVLEDSVLAERAAAGRVTLTDLMNYAAVCGVGLDTIPLAGEVSVGQLTAVLMDIAALAVRLNKPLTARLMPLPGLEVGDPVHFDFPYFAPSKVMAVPGTGVTGLLQQPERLEIQSRTSLK